MFGPGKVFGSKLFVFLENSIFAPSVLVGRTTLQYRSLLSSRHMTELLFRRGFRRGISKEKFKSHIRGLKTFLVTLRRWVFCGSVTCYLCCDLIIVMIQNILSYDPPMMNLMSGWDMNTCWPAFTIDTWNNNKKLLQRMLFRQPKSCHKTQFTAFLFPLNTINFRRTWNWFRRTWNRFRPEQRRFCMIREGRDFEPEKCLKELSITCSVCFKNEFFHFISLRNGTRDTEFV